MRIILFGFTGLGNAVLRGLLKQETSEVKSVFTRKYENPYPFYKEEQIQDLCKSEGIKFYNDKSVNSDEVYELLKSDLPELIIVASFSQIISKRIIELPSKGIINFHTSLLPKYRGPFPDQAVLLNGEKETGVTVHYLTEDLDSGNILLQRKLEISESDNYCGLKKKLAELSESMTDEVIRIFSGNARVEGEIQNEREATFYKKPKISDGYLENCKDIIEMKNKVRALNPFPGTSILVNGHRISVNNFELIDFDKAENYIAEFDEYVESGINKIGIRLFKNK